MDGAHDHPQYSDALAALNARLASFEERLVAVETAPPPTPDPDPDPTPTPTPGLKLPDPPTLVDPIDITVSNSKRSLRLDTNRDYRLHCPDVLDVKGGLTIEGGHNVVLVGGEVNFSQDYSDSSTSIGKSNRGLYLKGHTGIVHIEGLKIAGMVGEGIDLSCPECEAVQLVNLQIDATTGGRDTNHADIVQSWAGPRKLIIDGLTGTTPYQGFFLLPTQWATVTGFEPWEFRRINLSGADQPYAAYLFWLDDSNQGPCPPVIVEDVWGDPNPNKPSRDQWLWPKGDPKWDAVKQGTPPNGDFVTNAGVDYVRP